MAWKLIDSDGKRNDEVFRGEYMLGSAADIDSPPAENSKLEAGSIAYTADLTNMWQKNASGQWVKVGGG